MYKDGKYEHAVVLMTALIPTVGHKNLIGFASSLANHVTVIVSSREHEPIKGELRVFDIQNLKYNNVTVQHHTDNNAPQYPTCKADDDFWAYWKNIINKAVPNLIVSQKNAIVASEIYGQIMADTMGFDFIPYDIGRHILDVKGTLVRHRLLSGTWKDVLPLTQAHLQMRVCLFGAESCGKTTMASRLSNFYNGYFIPEWARSYCEIVGTEISKKKMEAIVEGQSALELHASKDLTDRPWLFFDTDILSTYGYYKIWDKNYNDEDRKYSINKLFYNISSSSSSYGYGYDLNIRKNFLGVKKDIYIVMNNQIPFTPDSMRYGIDKRESDTKFWTDILDDFGQKYHVVESTDPKDQWDEINTILFKMQSEKLNPVMNFKRE